MNVILVSQEYPPETGWGGIGTYTHCLAHGIANAGHPVRVLSLSVTGAQSDYTDGKVRVRRIPNAYSRPILRRLRIDGLTNLLSWSLSVRRALHQWLAEENADIIEMPLWNADGLFYSFGPPVRYLIRAETPHSVYARVNGFDRRWWAVNLKTAIWAEKVLARRAPRVIAISHAIAATLQHDYDVREDQLTVSYLGIAPVPEVTPAATTDAAPVTFLFVGRLEERKGIATLLDAIPAVVQRLPTARFVIAGRDSRIPGAPQTYTERFLATADDAAKSATTFLGFVEKADLDRLYRTCDVFVGPSIYESFGLVHLEAMACGKPVVGCRAGATPELVEHGKTGLLIPPRDDRALAEALVFLGANRPVREYFGFEGRKRMLEQFTEATMVRSTIEIYHAAMAAV